MSKFNPIVETVDEYGVLKAIKARAYPLEQYDDLDLFLQAIGDTKIVMLGEDTHGTHEFYTWRNMISRRLILEKGFNIIAAQGDMAEGYRINSFIKNSSGQPEKAAEVLLSFTSWPAWLWANREMAAFVDWLQKYNRTLPNNNDISFYGLDGFSLWQSLEAILQYLSQHHPDALSSARAAYQCFEPYRNPETNAYGDALPIVPSEDEKAVIELLGNLRQKTLTGLCASGDVLCHQIQTSLLAQARAYYQTMIHGGVSAWNSREQHMTDLLDKLMQHHGPQAKTIVWAHNTHIGDARASVLLDRGMYNIGELIRYRHPGKVFIAGFGTYRGSVTAASQWGARMEKMELPPARPGSWDHLLHRAKPGNKLLFMNEFREPWFTEDRLDLRAIGVVYNPRLDAYHNYVSSELASRYDAFLHIDVTSSLQNLP